MYTARTDLARSDLWPRDVRRIILEQSRRANVGHIGSCLCVVEILAALYGDVLKGNSFDDPDRDRFILSKGHAALALYAVLALKGVLTEKDLATFCGDGSLLGVHPDAALRGIDFSTGSLGHGLSMGAGAALAATMQGSSRRVFVLMSDAECNEGSVWEAAAFAAHHGLNNLHAIVDLNGQQAFGRTREVLRMDNMRERWESFGWAVTEVDGHSVPDLARAFSNSSWRAPQLVIARTVFGRGVRFMEEGKPVTLRGLPVQPINWHYLPMSDEEYEIAMADLEASG
jgi:transketolase